jgi:hypothetical protein
MSRCFDTTRIISENVRKLGIIERVYAHSIG